MSNEELKTTITQGLENLLSQLYESENIHHGDISPAQTLLWNDIVIRTTELFTGLINQNK